MIGYSYLFPKPHLWGGLDFGEFLFSSQINIMSDIQETIPTAAEAKKEPRRRWRFQYSLRTLMIFVTVVGVLCVWPGMILQRVQHQRRVVEQIEALGGIVTYDIVTFDYGMGRYISAPPPGPRIIRQIFGDDVFVYVVEVSFNQQNKAKDKDLALLRELPHLKRVSLDGPSFSDEGLKYVNDLKSLERLDLLNTNISGEGVALLERNKKLDSLSLCGAAVNDSKLTQIDKLTNLHRLQINQSSITDDGLIYISRLSELTDLFLEQNAQITDKGMESIRHLTNLETLGLCDTSVTSEGLTYFKCLTKLYIIEVGPNITIDDLEKVQSKLPHAWYEIIKNENSIEYLEL
jgi:hypothetical protein